MAVSELTDALVTDEPWKDRVSQIWSSPVDMTIIFNYYAVSCGDLYAAELVVQDDKVSVRSKPTLLTNVAVVHHPYCKPDWVSYAVSDGPPPVGDGCSGAFVVNYSAGINMISVPLDPGETWQTSDLLKHIGPEASMIIWYDKGARKFISFMPIFPENSPANATVKGGEGYILMMTKAKEVTYEGKAWDNVGGTPSPTVVLSEGNDLKTPIFAVTGLIQGKDGSYLGGIKVTVCNLNTGQKDVAVTGTTAGHGRYVVTLAGFTSGNAAQLDDTFLINVEASHRGFTNKSVKLKITRDDIRLANVAFDFTLEPLPAKTALLQNYPNPFNPETWIPFKLAQDSEVTIVIYDGNGQLVRLINLGAKPAGVYSTKDRAFYWDGKNDKGEKVASGLYFYQLKASDCSAVRKMVIVK
jgi:hypothetical protein